MNDILRILLGEARPRQAADESLFLSGRNYLGVRPPMPDIPPVAGLPPVPQQVGPVAGLVTINDNGQIIKLAPGEVYEGGIRIIPGPAPTFTGLLDDYPGAAAAFSLRRLSVNYTGPLVQVRRASDNDETTIPYKDDGTLDVGVLNAFAAGTDAFVSEWPDQSGNGYDAVQATTSAQPQIVASGSVLVDANGNPKVVSGSAQGLVATFSSTISQPTTIFTTGLVSSAASYLFDGIDATNRQARFTRFAFAGNTITASNGAGFGLESTLYNGSSSIYRRNGSPFSTGNIGTGGLAGVTLMCRYTIAEGNSELSEFILYNADKSSDFAGIESNINTYYSIY